MNCQPRMTTSEVVSTTHEDIIVSLVNRGDGYGERYDPQDPEDVNFLRFTVARLHNGRVYQFPDYDRATLIPAGTGHDVLRSLVEVLAAKILPYANGSRRQLEDACDEFAWVDPTWADRRIALSLRYADAQKSVAA